MIDIQYNKNIKISSDSLNYTICSLVNDKKKGKIWVPKYFYSSLENLVNDIVETEVRKSDAKTFEELLEAIKSVKKYCIKLFEEYDKKSKS